MENGKAKVGDIEDEAESPALLALRQQVATLEAQVGEARGAGRDLPGRDAPIAGAAAAVDAAVADAWRAYAHLGIGLCFVLRGCGFVCLRGYAALEFERICGFGVLRDAAARWRTKGLRSKRG